MNIKKRILSAIVAAAACVSMLAMSVSAVTPGSSDYGSADSKPVSATENTQLTSATTGSSVSIPAGALPAGVTNVTFSSNRVDASSAVARSATATAAAQGFTNATVFDLKLSDQNGTYISQLNGKVAVTIPVVDGANTVLYYNEATNTVENLGGTVSNGFITFETNHFSYYMLVRDANKAAGTTGTGSANSPATGDNATTMVIVAIMAAVALGTTVLTVKAKKSK